MILKSVENKLNGNKVKKLKIHFSYDSIALENETQKYE